MAQMPNVFFTVAGVPRAITSIRHDTNGQPQTLNTAIPDGDTIGVHLLGSGSIRFLGIDSPEKSFERPTPGPTRLDSQEWEDYLADPFLPQFGPFGLDPDLVAHLVLGLDLVPALTIGSTETMLNKR